MRRGECGWARKHKWRYLDKTLPAPKARRVEAHLTVCLPCRAEFALAQEALDALAAGKPLTPEQQRLLQGSRQAPSLGKRLTAMAMLTVLIGVAAYLWRLSGDAMWTRLNEWGVESGSMTPAPVPAPEPDLANRNAPAERIEPLDIESALEPAAPPIEMPAPRPEDQPRPKPPAPRIDDQPRLKPPAPVNPVPRSTASSTKKPTPSRRARTAPSTATSEQQGKPAEGTVEVFDEEGRLIKRERVKEGR